MTPDDEMPAEMAEDLAEDAPVEDSRAALVSKVILLAMAAGAVVGSGA